VNIMTSYVRCPECSKQATVLDRFVLGSTDGPIEHVRIRCVDNHHFMMPAERLVAAAAPEDLRPAS
jgi:hypothetical protein